MHIELVASCFTTGYGNSLALKLPALQVGGKIIAVIGHNGSGKSTLIKSILGLLTPRSGHLGALAVEGQSSLELTPELHMAFSPENGAVFADIRVENYLKLWCRIKQRNANYYLKQGSRFIDLLEIGPLLSKYGRELSKGQRRRVQTAIGYLCNPKLFLFDEPFDGLDIQQAHKLATVMLDESMDMSLIISSHRMDVVERMADQVIVLGDGEVLTSGTVPEVCETLGSRSITIQRKEVGEKRIGELVSEIKAHFSSLVVHRMGPQVAITGKGINTKKVSAFLNERNLNNVEIEVHKPSLSDAMSYHLKQQKSAI